MNIDHLTPPTQVWVQSVKNDFDLEPHHLRLLMLAAEALDRCGQARDAIGQHGITFMDKSGNPKARPEVSIERDNRIAFARLLRELDLDLSGPIEAPRAPAIPSNRG